MIYFKITDKNSEAWKRLQQLLETEKETKQKFKELKKELGIETDTAYLHLGTISAFKYEEGQNVPDGFRREKDEILPDNRTKAGKAARYRFRSIKFMTSDSVMSGIVGVSAHSLEGNRISTGMGFVAIPEKFAILSCNPSTWQNAESKEGFDYPDGLVEIKATEYFRLKDEIDAHYRKKEEEKELDPQPATN